MKKIVRLLLTGVLLLALAACGSAGEATPAGKTYIYENEGFGGGEFSITVNKDGTFSYSEGLFSSYVGVGEWSMEGDLITFVDEEYMDFSMENYFRFDGTNLIFMEENSTNFSYVEVKDGEIFYGETESESE